MPLTTIPVPWRWLCRECCVTPGLSLSLSVAPKVLAVVTYMDMALHGCLRRALATVAT
eukprot:m.433759 g.433759  ORF g.433759 m.433759 type:complete len:58 (+) comp95267_c0_seq1:114-287(+)